MAYHPDCLRAIIRLGCQLIEHWSPEAEELLLGTAAKESHLGRWIVQMEGGRARGTWQMEPATEWDIWHNFLCYDQALTRLVTRATNAGGPDPYRLQYDPVYGAIMARLHYMRIPDPLPAAHDVQALAEYWDIHYNKNPDKGFPWEFVELYYLLVLV